MPPWLRSDDGRNIVIRPLIRAFESELIAFSQEKAFPILPCNLCGSQENLQRQSVKALIDSLEERYPRSRESMLSALTRVRGTHLLDAQLWQALGMGPDHLPDGPTRGADRLRVVGQ
jgi:tRNA 2-thiocytidine biosynthesis protein TtcA